MRILFLLGILLGLGCGEQTIDQVNTNKVLRSHVNDIRAALYQDFVPRNSSGVPTNLEGPLGNSNYRWGRAYLEAITLGDPTNGLEIEENTASTFDFQVGGSTVVQIDSSGLDGSGIKSDSIAHDSLEDLSSGGTSATSPEIAVSSGSGLFSTTGTADVTNLSVSITTLGNPIEIYMISDSTGADTGVSHNTTSGDRAVGSVLFKRGGSTIALNNLISDPESGASGSVELLIPCSSYRHIDFVSSGTYTYKVTADSVTSGTVKVSNCKLIVRELF